MRVAWDLIRDALMIDGHVLCSRYPAWQKTSRNEGEVAAAVSV
jgi:hypothetical protein